MGRAGERHVSGRNGICKVLEVRTSLVCGQRGLELSKTVREEERVAGDSTTRINGSQPIQAVTVQARCLHVIQSVVGTHRRVLSRGIL